MVMYVALSWTAILSSVTAFLPRQNRISCCTLSPAKKGYQPLSTAARRQYHPILRFDSLVLLRNNKEIVDPKKGDDDDNDNADGQNNDDSDSNALFFDDFDFVIGDASRDSVVDPTTGTTTSSLFPGQDSLNERIRETKEQEMYRDTKLTQSWKQGDWSVRGFSLDPADALHEAAVENQMFERGGMTSTNNNIKPIPDAPRIMVSKVASDVNSEGTRIFVGRSNGSLVWVQLGNEYISHFRSKIRGTLASSPNNQDGTTNSNDINGNGNDDDKPSSISAQFSSELVPEPNQQYPLSEQGSEGTSFPPEGPAPPMLSPFKILAQFSPATNDGSAISAVLSVPDEDSIFTASEGSAQIHQWHINEQSIDSDIPALKTPVPLSEGIHNGAIVALKIVPYQGGELLLSVGSDGTMALWDIPSADLVYHCQVSTHEIIGKSEGGGEGTAEESIPALPQLVHCADVNENQIFLGTTLGLVLGYDVSDLLNAASSGGACPLPQGKFKAHEGSVTAIACGGPGSLGRLGAAGGGGGKKKTSSSVLLTGGENGMVKQWEILSSPSMQKMENWPKLPSQRLPKKAHIFQGHDGPITALEAMRDGRPQFLSASVDGTIRAWDAAKGKEEYRMDGFSEALSSLCLQGGGGTDDLLITDGMNQYVCVHDFSQGLSAGKSVDDYLEQWDD